MTATMTGLTWTEKARRRFSRQITGVGATRFRTGAAQCAAPLAPYGLGPGEVAGL
jgi:hypothetical protein